MSSRSLLLSSCSPSERMMKREFHLYLYNIDGGRTMVSRTRRREGNGGQRRKRPTAEEEDLPAPRLPCARGGSSLGTRGTGEGRGGEGSGVDDRATSGGVYDAASRGSGDPGVARARAKPTRPWKKKEAGGFACLAGFGSALPRRGACPPLVCPAEEASRSPRLPPVASAAASSSARPERNATDDAFFFFCSTLSRS